MTNIENSESLDYLNTYTDKEILEIVENPKDWTDEEIELAKRISYQRGLSEQLENSNSKKNKNRYENKVKNRAFVFLIIALLWVLNFYIGREGESLLGFGIHSLIKSLFNSLFLRSEFLLNHGQVIYLYILLLPFPILYVWIWQKSRKLNRTIYLIGMIVYAFDTVCFTINQMQSVDIIFSMFGVILHLFLLRLLFIGYKALLEYKNITENNGKN